MHRGLFETGRKARDHKIQAEPLKLLLQPFILKYFKYAEPRKRILYSLWTSKNKRETEILNRNFRLFISFLTQVFYFSNPFFILGSTNIQLERFC